MLEKIIKQIELLKKQENKIQNKIKNIENSIEEAPTIVDLEGQLDLLTDDRLLELYDIEEEIYYEIKQLYNIIEQNSYLNADIIGNAIAKLLTEIEGREYCHITPIHISREEKPRKIRIIVPKENQIDYITGTNSLTENTIVLDSNINGANLNDKICLISPCKHENISDDITDILYLTLNEPINGKFKDGYINIPSISNKHYSIIKKFIENIIEYKLENQKNELSEDEINMLLKQKATKKLTKI